jgi:hypothetical protein
MKALEITIKNRPKILAHKTTGITENRNLNKDIPQITTLMKGW